MKRHNETMSRTFCPQSTFIPGSGLLHRGSCMSVIAGMEETNSSGTPTP